MRLRTHRPSHAAWNSLIKPVSRYPGPFTRPARTRRIRWWIRTAALLSIITVRDLAHARLTRWWPVAAGIALTMAGFVCRGGPGSVALLPGLMLLVSAPFVLPGPPAEHARRLELKRELAEYSTPAQRCDLENLLDRYPDSITGRS